MEEKEELNNATLKIEKWKIIVIGICAVVCLLIIIPVVWYHMSLSAVSKNSEKVEIEIPLGSSSATIAEALKENQLIKNKQAFQLYIKLNNITNFQAGNYVLNKNMDVKEIANILQTGILYDTNNITITFLEGKTMRWYASKIAENTNHTEEEVYLLLENEDYINSLIEKYWFLTEEIKNDNIYYLLEGYLFPDTYQFESKDVEISEILETLLEQTEKKLEKYKEEIQERKYSVHQLLTMASIVEMEGVHDEDRKDIASVFYNRLNENMPLGSDVTTYYAMKVEVGERDLYKSELNTYNPYNTRGPRMNGKLPIGPISSMGETSIEAAIHPNTTDYLFFVADKNGKVYFTKTNEEHDKKVEDLKKDGLWFEF